jgi:hypothetical protein
MAQPDHFLVFSSIVTKRGKLHTPASQQLGSSSARASRKPLQKPHMSSPQPSDALPTQLADDVRLRMTASLLFVEAVFRLSDLDNDVQKLLFI